MAINNVIREEYYKLLERSSIGKNKSVVETIDSIIKEEVQTMLDEAEKRGAEIEKKLEELRNSLIKEGKLTLRERGSARNNVKSLPERRIPIQTVSEIIDVPINELAMFFLNGHRIHEGHQSLFEYRLGEVYFYAHDPEVGGK